MELIATSITTGFQVAVDSAPAIFAKLGTIILDVFKGPLTYIQAYFDFMLQNWLALYGQIPGVGKLLGLQDMEATTFQDALSKRREEGLKFNLGTGEFGLQEIGAAAGEAWETALEAGRARLGDLMRAFDDFASRAARGPASTVPPSGRGTIDLPDTRKGKAAQVSDWERIGFVFNGASASMDYARTTAQQTRAMAATLLRIERKLPPGFTEREEMNGRQFCHQPLANPGC